MIAPDILHPKHYAELHDGSGISDEIIEASGAYTEHDPEKIKQLGFKSYQARGSALVFRYSTVNGWPEGAAMKPDNPRTERKPDGRLRVVKYEYPEGSANHIYCPPWFREDLGDASKDLLLTEGIKKTLAAASHGLLCLGFAGVWNWITRQETPYAMPLADFGHINLKARRVGIVFDSDILTNENVRQAAERLAHLLTALGAAVYLIILPAAADGSKQGLDDYLLHNPASSVWGLAQKWQDMVVQRVCEERDAARREAAEAKAARSQTVYALRNKEIKSERMVAVAAANLLEHKKDTEAPIELPGKGGGWYQVYRDAVAEQAGCSPKTASTHLDTLSDWGVIEKTLDVDPRQRVDSETGEILPPGPKQIFLRWTRPLSETLAITASIKPEKDGTWGGARPKTCPDHPNAGTVKKWTLHCQECDRILDEGKDYKRPTYQDDTYPDKHAEELVNTPPDATGEPMFHLDPPRLVGIGESPSSNPMFQDDTYPSEPPEDAREASAPAPPKQQGPPLTAFTRATLRAVAAADRQGVPPSMADLAQVMRAEPATIGNSLKWLMARGFAVHTGSGYRLTDAGRAVLGGAP